MVNNQGEALRKAVHAYKNKMTKDALVTVFELLWTSEVVVPCDMVLKERDQMAWEKLVREAQDDPDSLVGMELTAQDEVRMVPDLLTHAEGDLYLPVFSSAEQAGEYGAIHSLLNIEFPRAIGMALSHKRGAAGIVLDPFTDSFMLPKEYFELVEEIGSAQIDQP